ncbi:MAG: elongation factor Ts [Prevotella sp.]|nr:elongation factor Ts [Prevotella sp.]
MDYKPNMEDIKKLRTMTGAGLADVKKALTEAEGDFDRAKEILRERGLAIAAKRSDRETSNGCVLVKKVEGFAAMIAVKCETDFVANGADFIAMTQSILDAAVANKCKTLDEVKELEVNGQKAQDVVTQRSGITGEKMELDGYLTLEGDNVEVYDHMGKHMLCTMVQLNKENVEVGHKLAMQVAAMKPVALDAQSVEQKILDEEYKTAVEKTKLEQVEKFVDMKLKKAGINPNLVDSEDHIESNMAKGWLTKDQADEARKIIVDAKAEGEAQLKPVMIENIAKGRVQKFLKENCLVDQEFQFGDGDKVTVTEWLKQQDKELKIAAFRRFTLVAE